MAKKRPRRSRIIAPIQSAAPVTHNDRGERLIEYIDDERRRLMGVTSLLEIMRIAIEEKEFAEEAEPNDPCFSDVASIARDVVQETINRLDSVALRPMIEARQ